MTPARIRINGRVGAVVYLDAQWQPVPAAEATLATVRFDDGGHAFYTVTPARTDLDDAFEAQHPRDDHGRFGEGGDTPSIETRWTAVKDTLAVAIGHAGSAFVERSPISVHVAEIATGVLAEMRDHGYRMPDEVFVQRDARDAPHGETSSDAWRPQQELHLYFPATLPADADPDAAVRATFSGQDGDVDRFTVRDVRDVILHEMGHVQARTSGEAQPITFFDTITRMAAGAGGKPATARSREAATLRLNRITESVSRYAQQSPSEFVAEAFVRLYRGETLTPDAAALYAALKGPAIR